MASLASTLWNRLEMLFCPVKTEESIGWKFYQEAETCYRRYFHIEEADNTLYAALDNYGLALEYMPEEPSIFQGLAKTCLALGLYERAENNANRSIRGFEKRSTLTCCDVRGLYETTCILGAVAAHRADWTQAVTVYAKALQWGGFSSGIARSGLANALWMQVKTKSFSPVERLGLLHQAGCSFLTAFATRLFEAVASGAFYTWFSVGLRLLPQAMMASFCEETGQTDTALGIYKTMALQYPGLASIGIGIGELYRGKGEIEWSKGWFQKVLDRHPLCMDALSNLAGLYEREENYMVMGSLTQKMLMITPSDSQLWCQLANAHYYSHDYREALQAYETAFHLGADLRWRASIAQGMGNIQANHLENNEAAIAYYEIALALNPTDLDNHLHLGLLYFEQENYGNAELVYRKAILLDPHNPRLYSNLGYLRWMVDDVDVAVNYYKKAIALAPDYEVPLNNLGVIYLDMLGEPQQAYLLFERAVEINPQYALAYYNLGRACCFLGERHSAALHFRRARELNHHSHELDNDELTARINQLFD